MKPSPFAALAAPTSRLQAAGSERRGMKAAAGFDAELRAQGQGAELAAATAALASAAPEAVATPVIAAATGERVALSRARPAPETLARGTVAGGPIPANVRRWQSSPSMTDEAPQCNVVSSQPVAPKPAGPEAVPPELTAPPGPETLTAAAVEAPEAPAPKASREHVAVKDSSREETELASLEAPPQRLPESSPEAAPPAVAVKPSSGAASERPALAFVPSRGERSALRGSADAPQSLTLTAPQHTPAARLAPESSAPAARAERQHEARAVAAVEGRTDSPQAPAAVPAERAGTLPPREEPLRVSEAPPSAALPFELPHLPAEVASARPDTVSAPAPLVDPRLLGEWMPAGPQVSGVMSAESARLTMTLPDLGELALHVQVHDGMAQIEVSGAAAARVEQGAQELARLLAVEGLGLSSVVRTEAPSVSASGAAADLRDGHPGRHHPGADEGARRQPADDPAAPMTTAPRVRRTSTEGPHRVRA